ncbi:MAG: pyridoxal kinase PdxY [Rhodospirillaceae bacterium]|jgi:pyridoxine kinase|nr:pyridoxal kinase PdxY [Rhodospirillaceae bacterium]MBT5943035.1 pyridoxal kinase PdxY [Rhodospirillaceae bacterium]MBT6403750.1 pyridoxal kinase PdxY [Rhodospirillaceae bacterium]MBT6537654.1 pyridoxal kinase PdxY [Rhodospirillaceae bacterium]MBT7363071.1 pyridoxal kinase PdxY [Rhodospirillaceae bacterium]
MHILSVQSQVVFGHVGNSATSFPLQCLGHEVWSVPTAILSNHAGYPDFGGQTMPPATVSDLLHGLDRRGVFSKCDLMISGYLGNTELAALVTETVGRIRATNPNLIYCCDPVMGDDGSGLYVDAALPQHFRDTALPVADITTPNLFELAVLCGLDAGALKAASVGDIVAAGRTLLAHMRPGATVMVTSADHRDLDLTRVAVIAISDSEAWCVDTPRIVFPSEPHGAGDLLSALFAAAMAEHRSPARALEDSVATVFAVLSETHRQAADELELVAARDAIVSPEQQFTARSVG